jgi:hypothetical protein
MSRPRLLSREEIKALDPVQLWNLLFDLQYALKEEVLQGIPDEKLARGLGEMFQLCAWHLIEKIDWILYEYDHRHLAN